MSELLGKERNIMWNQRYAGDEFAYGTEPNSFLVQNAKILIGPVLSLAEGEGRNAVFLASLGLDVLGVDGSEAGLARHKSLQPREAWQSERKLLTLRLMNRQRIFLAQSFRSPRTSQVRVERDCIVWWSAP